MANNRRPQAPKRRNYVAKNVGKVHRPQTFRDRTKYDRYEDYLKNQLDDMVDGIDAEKEAEVKKEFVAAISGDEYDPEGRKNYEEWLDAQDDDLSDLKRWDYHGLEDVYDDPDFWIVNDDPDDDYEEYDEKAKNATDVHA